MALDCLGTGGNREHLQLDDSSALDLPSSGWTLSFLIYPSTVVGINLFSYFYSHGAPLGSVSAINLFVELGDATIRIIIDQTGGNLVDFNTTNAVNQDAWNSFAVAYNGTIVTASLNGSSNGAAPPSLGNVVPIGNARIGDASHNSGREFNGRIAHASKWDRAFQIAELNQMTEALISPEFYHENQIWHVPIWNASFNFDRLRAINTTPQSALYGQHSPARYPSGNTYVLPINLTPPTGNLQAGAQWTFA